MLRQRALGLAASARALRARPAAIVSGRGALRGLSRVACVPRNDAARSRASHQRKVPAVALWPTARAFAAEPSDPNAPRSLSEYLLDDKSQFLPESDQRFSLGTPSPLVQALGTAGLGIVVFGLIYRLYFDDEPGAPETTYNGRILSRNDVLMMELERERALRKANSGSSAASAATENKAGASPAK